MSEVSVGSERIRTRAESAAIGLTAGCLLVFFCLTLLIDTRFVQTADESLVLATRLSGNTATPVGPAWLAELARDVTALGGYLVLTLITVFVWLFLRFERTKVMANRFVVTVTGGYFLNVLLKTVIARPRPDVVPFLTQIHSLSFPSGHAMMSTVVFLTLGIMLSEVATRRAVRALVIASPVVIAAAVSLTRVYLGVHFPTDVVAGLCCGIAWTLGCWLFWRRRDSNREWIHAAKTDSDRSATG
ncbi:MAG: phosphatase PAP2 family protein [Planctomycetota bacterium]|nr:phosphatase PAP2 family protein [Planctomycetota bacterium]MDA1247794.1 phosphatase PAP2 family protein [Planctomycetota bacterium]